MPRILKFRRGTTSQLANTLGSEGELFVDTSLVTLIVHNGITTGGTTLARNADLTNLSSTVATSLNNLSSTVATSLNNLTSQTIATTSLTIGSSVSTRWNFTQSSNGSLVLGFSGVSRLSVDTGGTITATTGNFSAVLVNGVAPGGFSNMEVFTSSSTFTVPAGVTKVKVTVVGGGGNGSLQADDGEGFFVSGSGGGAGGAAIEIISGLTPGTSVSVTVGGAGGTSSFGPFCSATGGTNAVTTLGTSSYGPGVGGVGSGGNLNINGQSGNIGGNNGFTGGSGGTSIMGGGGRGGLSVGGANIPPSSGGNYGGGGGGCNASGGAVGSGSPGVVVVEY